MKTVKDILAQKSKHERITMLTAYDYPIASYLDEAGIDIILVGDSLANVVLGLESTTQVGMTEMLHHAKAVVRAAKAQALLSGRDYVAPDDVQAILPQTIAHRLKPRAGSGRGAREQVRAMIEAIPLP